VNARAEFDGDGLGGQTAVFHAVNSNGNYCRPVMELLVEAGADLDVRLKGLVWGMGFAWETTIFDVTPISYAQCGLYFQFHRKEQNVYGNIAYLWRNKYGSEIKCAMCRTNIWRMRGCFRRGCRQRIGRSAGCVDQRCCAIPPLRASKKRWRSGRDYK